MNETLIAPPETRMRATSATGVDFIRCVQRRSSLGWSLIAASDAGVCAILLGDSAESLHDAFRVRFPGMTELGPNAEFDRLADHVVALIEAPASPVAFPVDARGTTFQRRVWTALRDIPPGRTASYADIAGRIGAPKATRAVAGACGANPVAVAIPCHRVLRSDGALSGYRWGVERKRALLAREGVFLAN